MAHLSGSIGTEKRAIMGAEGLSKKTGIPRDLVSCLGKVQRRRGFHLEEDLDVALDILDDGTSSSELKYWAHAILEAAGVLPPLGLRTRLTVAASRSRSYSWWRSCSATRGMTFSISWVGWSPFRLED